jgi:hypothetical protein
MNPVTFPQNVVSSTTANLLKTLDHEALASCLYAACDLALKASRGQLARPPENLGVDQLVRQIISEMPPRNGTSAGSSDT